MLQAAVLEFARQGHYDAHVKSVASVGLAKRKLLLDAMRKHFPPGCTWTEPDGTAGSIKGVDVLRVRDGLVSEKLAYVKG